MSQRYFLTTESTYEALRLAVDADLGYPTATADSIFTPALQAPRDSLRRIVLAVDSSLPGYSQIVARVTPLLANSSVQELTEAEYLAFLACVSTSVGEVDFTTVVDTLSYTNFLPAGGTLDDALSGIDSALTGKAGTGDLVLVAGAGTNSIKPAGTSNTVGNYSVILGGDPQLASGVHSVICGGSSNSISGDYSSVLCGQSNDGGSYNNVHLIGSYITAAAADFTLVNNLHIVGAWNGSALTGGVLKFADGTTQSTAGAALSHAHSAADITSGTVATARLGSGTASSSTFLRGDGTWAAAGSNSASDLTTGTLSDSRLSTNAQAAINLYLWSSFR